MRILPVSALSVVLAFILCGCEDHALNTFSNRIDAPTFTVYTPKGWTLTVVPELDTHNGWIKGPDDIIYYDQGYLNFGALSNVMENDRTIYFESLTINDVPAVIHKEMVDLGNAEGIRLSVFLDASDKGNLNHLFVINPSSPLNEAVIIEIFKTHRFK